MYFLQNQTKSAAVTAEIRNTEPSKGTNDCLKKCMVYELYDGIWMFYEFRDRVNETELSK